MEARIVRAAVEFAERPFVKPLVLSSGAIACLTEAVAEVTVRVGPRTATGRGSVYLSDLWAWPDPSLNHARKDRALRALCRSLAGSLGDLCGTPAHPLELGLRLHHRVCGESGPPPALARAMCASPFDAAIHDAAGLALGVSAFGLYAGGEPLPEADACFGAPGAACRAIRAAVRRPATDLPAWLIVGKADDLERDVAPWVRERGYRCFKLKLMGAEAGEDAARTAEVFRAVARFGAQAPRLTVDTNEGNPDSASVLAYLERLEALDGAAYGALEYLEQPTSRDILGQPQDWRRAAARKPILLDEGLTHVELLPEAVRQGWSGLALKTCKGHSFALLAAAWAREHGLAVSLQDLTNPGYSLVHAALFAAHVPTLNGAELNSPQFTPEANRAWRDCLPELVEPRDGHHRLPPGPIPGLGSALAGPGT